MTRLAKTPPVTGYIYTYNHSWKLPRLYTFSFAKVEELGGYLRVDLLYNCKILVNHTLRIFSWYYSSWETTLRMQQSQQKFA